MEMTGCGNSVLSIAVRIPGVLCQMPGFKYRGIFTFRDPGPVGTANLLPAAGKDIGKAGPFFQMGILHQFIFLEMGLDDQVIIQLGVHFRGTADAGQKLGDGPVFLKKLPGGLI